LLTIEATAEAIVAEGIASPDQVQAAMASLAAAVADETVVFGGVRHFPSFALSASVVLLDASTRR
jgi:hypothetical protein